MSVTIYLSTPAGNGVRFPHKRFVVDSLALVSQLPDIFGNVLAWILSLVLSYYWKEGLIGVITGLQSIYQ